MSQIKSGLYKVNERVAVVESDVATVSGNLSTLQSDLSTVQGSVSSLNSSVSTLSGDVSTLSGTVSSLGSTVASQGSSISTLQSQVGGFNSSITELTNKTEKLKFKVVTTINASDLFASKGYGGGLLVWDDSADYTTDTLDLFSQGFVSSYSGGVLESDVVRVANKNQQNKNLTVRLSKKNTSGYQDLLISHGSESVCIIHDTNADNWILMSGGRM